MYKRQALGAATGELVFSEIMLGQFGGLGELEKFITVTIGVYIAGRMVKDPTNRKMVGIAAITGTCLLYTSPPFRGNLHHGGGPHHPDLLRCGASIPGGHPAVGP